MVKSLSAVYFYPIRDSVQYSTGYSLVFVGTEPHFLTGTDFEHFTCKESSLPRKVSTSDLCISRYAEFLFTNL